MKESATKPENKSLGDWRFRQSGKYLLATQFDNDTGKRSGWVDYDLREFGLGEPIERLRDNPGELALWRL